MLAQIEAAGVIVKRGSLVDATIVQSARQAPPKGGTGGDTEAGWAVKNGRPVAHGCKAHIALDDGSESVRAIETTSGSVHHSVLMDKLLDRAPAQAVYTDAAHCNTARRKRLRDARIAPRIRFNPSGGTFTPTQTALNHRRWSVLAA